MTAEKYIRKQPAPHAEDSGFIFNIQRFSVHDGPGIRTTVFLKGCPLRCLWCSNPESRHAYPELMVRDINCRGCGACIEACPQGAITITEETGRIIDRGKCNRCLLCVDSCLYHALNRCGQRMGVQDVLAEVMPDVLFYKNSGGGVTLSGGEPLLQSGFAVALLEACQKEGLPTALETTGCVPWKEMEAVLRFVDVTLFDIKHLHPDRHRKATGVTNRIILKNLRKAAAISNIWLRVPLIAGYNDSREHIKEVAALGREIGAQKISLLPYHEGGRSKCEQLGMPYGFPEGRAPAERHLLTLKRLIEKTGQAVSVGL